MATRLDKKKLFNFSTEEHDSVFSGEMSHNFSLSSNQAMLKGNNENSRNTTMSSKAQRINPTTTSVPTFNFSSNASYKERLFLDSAQETNFTAHRTSVQKLSNATKKLHTSVMELINYQNDFEITCNAVLEFTHLLQSVDDLTDLRKTMLLILQLSKRDASDQALCQSDELIRVILNYLENSEDADMRIICCSIIHYLTTTKNGVNIVLKYLTIPVLINLLSDPIKHIVIYSLGTLHNILVIYNDSKPIVREHGGTESILRLLPFRNKIFDIKAATIAVDCLHILAFFDEPTKEILAQHNVPECLVFIMSNPSCYNADKLLIITSKLLKVLSINLDIKETIVKAGGIEALSKHLSSKNAKLSASVLWVLRNLSDVLLKPPHGPQGGSEKLIKELVVLAQSKNAHIMTCACGCLCNFTCENAANKRFFVEHGGVDTLCNIMGLCLDRAEVTEPIACALRHVTHGHDIEAEAVELCRKFQGLKYTVQILFAMHQQTREGDLQSLLSGYAGGSIVDPSGTTINFSWPLLKSLLGLLRNMAFNSHCRKILRALEVIPLICNTLIRAHTGAQELAQQRASIVSITSELSYVDGVRLDDMCELSMSVLFAFASDDICRSAIVSRSEILPVVVQLLYLTSVVLQRVATGLICVLCLSREEARRVEQEGATSRLTQLLHSTDNSVSCYAAACLYRMAFAKPDAYRCKLANELCESLAQAGILEGPELAQLKRDSVAYSASNHQGGIVNGAPGAAWGTQSTRVDLSSPRTGPNARAVFSPPPAPKSGSAFSSLAVQPKYRNETPLSQRYINTGFEPDAFDVNV